MMIVVSWHCREILIPCVPAVDTHYQTPTPAVTEDDQVSRLHLVVEAPETWTAQMGVLVSRIPLANYRGDLGRAGYASPPEVFSFPPADGDSSMRTESLNR